MHGAGSYGHFEAAQYQLNKGFFRADSAQGLSLCRTAMSILNQTLMAKLVELRLPVLAVALRLVSSDGVVSRRQLRPSVHTSLSTIR